MVIRRSSLELVILAMVDRASLNTPYGLQRHARLSPASAAQALRRLNQDGLVTAGPAVGRGKREYKLTKKGKEVLKAGWEQCLADEPKGEMGIPTDFDSVLRIAWLAVVLGKGKGEGGEFLGVAAQQWARMAETAKQGAEKAEAEPNGAVGLFAWMRAHSEVHRLEAEAATLKELSMLIQEHVTASSS